jgi:hypothetical protein
VTAGLAAPMMSNLNPNELAIGELEKECKFDNINPNLCPNGISSFSWFGRSAKQKKDISVSMLSCMRRVKTMII